MARIRVAVALLLPTRVSDEVDGIRRAFGVDPGYIPPHITVVPPLNLGEDNIAPALSTLRSAARSLAEPLTVELGPFDTFLPRNPVLYLAVGGDLERLSELRQRCLVGPLSRDDSRPYVPHVTITRGLAPEDDAVARRMLESYRSTVQLDRVHLLVQVTGAERRRQWVPTADMAFEPGRVVGVGGFEIELSVSTLADPEVRRMLGAFDLAVATPAVPAQSFVVVARHDDNVVGVAWGRQADRAAILDQVFVPEQWRRRGTGRQLMAVAEHEVARRGASVIEAPSGLTPEGLALLDSRGWTSRPGPGGPRPWRALGPDHVGQSNSIEL